MLGLEFMIPGLDESLCEVDERGGRGKKRASDGIVCRREAEPRQGGERKRMGKGKEDI